MKTFLVSRSKPYAEGVVRFTRNPDRILIEWIRNKTSVKVTLVLYGNGDYRYQINSGGEFLRWQVLKLAVQEFFFMGSGKERKLTWSSSSLTRIELAGL